MIKELVDLKDYLNGAAEIKNAEMREIDVKHSFSRGLAGGASNGFALAAEWIDEILGKV
jgi:hypothetical protein